MYDKLYKEELPLTDILTKSFEIYSKYFKSFFLIAAMVYIPFNILIFVLTVTLKEHIDPNLLTFVPIFIKALLTILVISALMINVETVIAGKEIDYIYMFNRSFKTWGTSFFTASYSFAIIMVFMVLLIVPGIIRLLYFMFIFPAVVLRNKSIMDAMEHSKKLVTNRIHRVLAITLMLGITLVMFYFMTTGIVTLLHHFFFSWAPISFFKLILRDSVFDIIFSYAPVSMTIFFLNLDFVTSTTSTVSTTSTKKIKKKQKKKKT